MLKPARQFILKILRQKAQQPIQLLNQTQGIMHNVSWEEISGMP